MNILKQCEEQKQLANTKNKSTLCAVLQGYQYCTTLRVASLFFLVPLTVIVPCAVQDVHNKPTSRAALCTPLTCYLFAWQIGKKFAKTEQQQVCVLLISCQAICVMSCEFLFWVYDLQKLVMNFEKQVCLAKTDTWICYEDVERYQWYNSPGAFFEYLPIWEIQLNLKIENKICSICQLACIVCSLNIGKVVASCIVSSWTIRVRN